MPLDRNYGKVCERTINNHSGIMRRQRDVGPGVTAQRYHNNGRLIMLEVNCIKFSLGIQNSLGIIMSKFHARKSKTEGMAASVRVFLEHPSYIKPLIKKDTSDILCIGKFWKASEK